MTPTEKLCIEKFERNNITSWTSWNDFKTSKLKAFAHRSPVGLIQELMATGSIESEEEGWRAVYSYMQHMYGSK